MTRSIWHVAIRSTGSSLILVIISFEIEAKVNTFLRDDECAKDKYSTTVPIIKSSEFMFLVYDRVIYDNKLTLSLA